MTSDNVKHAYDTVEKMLRGAVEGAKSPQEFSSNLQYCQIVGTRLLAVLIYNSHTQNNLPLEPLLEKVGIGIKSEIQDIVEASKDESKLQMVGVNFEVESKDAKH